MIASIFSKTLRQLLFISIIFIASCNEEQGTPVFTDDTGLRLKSISSYNDTNPNQIFTTVFNYSSDGRLSNTQSNSLGSTVSLIYDSNGQLIQIDDYEYFYDSNQVIRIENDNLTSAFGTYESSTINYFNGNIVSITDRYLSDTRRRIIDMNVSYNNQGQIILYTRTSKDIILASNQEFITQKDKASFTYNSSGNVREISRENDYESESTPAIEIDYIFDTYKNPAQLLLKTMGIEEDRSVLFLRSISERNYFNAGPLFNYFTNNIISYNQIPQTADPGFRDLRFRVEYDYNEYGYPISATETQTSLTGNFEIITFYTWEYEEY